MFWSAITSSADKARRRPEWLERDGDDDVVVQGYSILDNLAFGGIAAIVILAPVVLLLVSTP